MRDKKFIINSIKMDLFRVVTAVGNINNPIPQQSVKEFLMHAMKDFDKTTLNEREKELKIQLEKLCDSLPLLRDPLTRLKWAENVLTVRCRI
jgi:hypothetical protein